MSIRNAAATAFAATALVAALALYREGLWDLVAFLALLASMATGYLSYRALFAPRLGPSGSAGVPTAAAPVAPVPAPPGDGLDNDAWLRLVEEDVELIDELDRHRLGLDDSGQALADHVTARLREVLERADVEVIDADLRFDRVRHAPVDSPAAPAPGAVIAEVVSPGFAVGPRVLRRAQVRLRP